MHEVLVNHIGGISLPKKGVVRLTDRPDLTLDVYRGRKTTIQHNNTVDFLNTKIMGKENKQQKRFVIIIPARPFDGFS